MVNHDHRESTTGQPSAERALPTAAAPFPAGGRPAPLPRRVPEEKAGGGVWRTAEHGTGGSGRPGERARDRVDPELRELLGRQEAFVLATADREGVCDSSFHTGPPGFVRVLDDRTVAYPSDGPGQAVPLANIRQNPQVAMLLLDAPGSGPGPQVKGRARVVPDDVVRARYQGRPAGPGLADASRPWIVVEVQQVLLPGAAVQAAAHGLPPAPGRLALAAGDGTGAGALPVPVPRHGRKPFTAPVPADPQAWRRAAEEVLAEARQRALAGAARSSPAIGAGFRGWFS